MVVDRHARVHGRRRCSPRHPAALGAGAVAGGRGGGRGGRSPPRRRVAAAAGAARVPAAAMVAAVPALGLSPLGMAALAVPVDGGAAADARLAATGAGGTRCGDPRAAHCRGRDGRSDFRAVGVGCGADDPRGRRAALPDHHAEPAARSLADHRKRASPRRLPRLLRR